MARSQESYSKKEKEKKRIKKRELKSKRKEERRANSKGGGLENMLVYVDENGHLTDTPPDPANKVAIEAEDIVIGIPKKEDRDEEPLIREGKIAFFNDSKGYGFIRENMSGEKYFVHVNGLLQPVAENDKVTFDLERGMKGMNAVNVKKID
ncbi:cold-shock protein [Ascidiimonas sp. W6]|uniref:cold-shock protein n=1 Tax=Ascidiimonas meishanensis TaxID=3128903 RepID=UPI0030ED78D9